MKISVNTSLLELGCLVCEALKKAGVPAFLSGGAVVTIYSENEYQSYDLDFISHGDFSKITRVMVSLGFTREKGRHFVHPRSKFFVEFPGTAATVGDEPISEFEEIRTKAGVLKLLTPTYCVMDRLSAFYHWKDEQSLEQAVLVARAKHVSLEKIREWSKREGMVEKYKEFEDRFTEKTKMSGKYGGLLGAEEPLTEKPHPWRLCPTGEHWVTSHPLRIPASQRSPLGGLTQRGGHCAKNPSGKDQLYPLEIQKIAETNFSKVRVKPCSDDLGFGRRGTAFDDLVGGWVQYWNDVLNYSPPLDPNLVKALIATESSFEPKKLANKRNSNSARGLMQLTNGTRKILADEKGELKDHFVTATQQQLIDPNTNICAGIRWLFNKRRLAAEKLGRSASWEEAVAEYKGLAKDLAKGSPRAEELMDRFRKNWEKLKKCRGF